VQFCNEAKSCAYWLVNETLWYETETRPRRLETASRDRDIETDTTSLTINFTMSLSDVKPVGDASVPVTVVGLGRHTISIEK